jgi:hypothetical protein
MVVGLKVMLKVQLPPGLTVVPQIFVWTNGPVLAMLLIVRTPRPVLVSVTVLALLVLKTTWVGKVTLLGEKVTAGKTPTPLSGSDCGLPGALSVMFTAAFRVPVAVGVKATVILQVPLGGTDVPQSHCGSTP